MDPLSVTAGVIAVAGLAYNSGKALYDLIETYRHSTHIFDELISDIEGLNSALSSLRSIGGQDRGASFSQKQCQCLEKVGPAMRNCSEGYEAFKIKVTKLISNSTPKHKRDKFMLHFKINDIAAFKIRLNGYKSTLTIALLVVSLESSSEGSKDLGDKVEAAIGRFAGQIEGIKLSMQAVQEAGGSNQSLVESMAQTAEAISRCAEVCKAATTVSGSVTYKSVQAFDNARFMLGNTNTEPVIEGTTRVFGEVIDYMGLG
ncbi:hypothetical protein F53441_7952 [Fusarium austroafricanum]|uniref:Azaphilone pigments biosynthesis cluster protein L N-terminal domain-containing protein n=1 Tax=Fusarium austroafricanum TaxID=2364996 RepID=A0A8H4NX23_9HYPO|nr:hypothetical protein F53441_7952 [Fusarium austroafricanum]